MGGCLGLGRVFRVWLREVGFWLFLCWEILRVGIRGLPVVEVGFSIIGLHGSGLLGVGCSSLIFSIGPLKPPPVGQFGFGLLSLGLLFLLHSFYPMFGYCL